MSDLFQGLEIGRPSLPPRPLNLFSARHKVGDSQAPDVSGQRMTTNSTRRAEFANVGSSTGIQALSVNQLRDTMLASQHRRETNSLGGWDTMRSLLDQMQLIFSGSNAHTPGELLTTFHGSWQQLANHPTPASRQAVLEQAQLLVRAFGDTDRDLSRLEGSLNTELQKQVTTLNQIGGELASLNRQIALGEPPGDVAGGGREKRDVLLGELARRLNISVENTSTGATNVKIGGTEFVVRHDVFELAPEVSTVSGKSRTDLVWMNSGRPVEYSGGEIEALVQARDSWIPESREALNQLAESLATHVNDLHRQGATADGRRDIALFDPAYVTADRVQVSAQVADNPQQNIVTGRSRAPGDIDVAQALADLAFRPVMPDGRTTLNGYYDSVVATIGMRSTEATNLTETQTLLVEQLDGHRQSPLGASVDEELALLIKFHHANEAAARVTANMDEAISAVINGWGIAGR